VSSDPQQQAAAAAATTASAGPSILDQVMAESQEQKSQQQKCDAEQAQKEYDELNDKDDQFDLCDASLAISLALMGVTALTKKWWLFFVSLAPAAFGFYMGIAGFCGIDTDAGPIKALIKLLS
jgi:hypothetical protein